MEVGLGKMLVHKLYQLTHESPVGRRQAVGAQRWIEKSCVCGLLHQPTVHQLRLHHSAEALGIERFCQTRVGTGLEGSDLFLAPWLAGEQDDGNVAIAFIVSDRPREVETG